MTMHDGSYKHIFSHAPIVEDLLRGFVHEDWVSQIDYGSLEKVSGSYVTDDLRERKDDIIWRVRFKRVLSGVVAHPRFADIGAAALRAPGKPEHVLYDLNYVLALSESDLRLYAMTAYTDLQQKLDTEPKTWLITGVAGFIGSNLLEALLKLNQRVVGLDNFSTGHQRNLDEVQTLVTPKQWANFHFIRGDIRNLEDCRSAMHFSPRPQAGEGPGVREKPNSVDYVLHQAALGSVPRSIEDPIITNQNNIDGFLNMLVAARDAKVKRFVYAASSSTYGDHPDLPKVEDKIGKPLSPYAVTKLVNELYADVFAKVYGLNTIGLRYFNIFGRRQDPDGAYAAVIPKWIAAMIKNEPVYINGDGETSRDFCYIDNAVQANLLAATTTTNDATNQVYNVAVGDRTSLNQLYFHLRDNLVRRFPHLQDAQPIYRDFRAGDVRHSLADISKAHRLIGYLPTHRIGEGLKEAMDWYVNTRPLFRLCFA